MHLEHGIDDEQFADLYADPAAFGAGLDDDSLIALWCAAKDARTDPTWPSNDEAADRRVVAGLGAELASRRLLVIATEIHTVCGPLVRDAIRENLGPKGR